MVKRSKFIGEILSELGLITPEDIDRALAFQRERGGYLGEALVHLGIISPDQLNFGLADQFDLPFVHLRPETIDHDVARMVPPEWARENLILPVLMDGDAVTVIVARPPSDDGLATVQRFTCAARVQAAISTADTIRSLISAVHQDGCGEEVPVMELVERAQTAGARMVGVSSRAGRARGWFRGAAGTVRCCVARGWEADLQLALSPVRDLSPGIVESWPAILSSGGRAWRIESTFMRSAGGVEWTGEMGLEIPLGSGRPRVADELLNVVQEASGGRIVLAAGEAATVPSNLGELMLPLLPAALLRPLPRSVHVTDRPVACAPDVLMIEAGPNARSTISALAALELDAITLDLDHYDLELLAAASAAAPLVVIRSADGDAVAGTDFDARLHATGDSLLWMLTTPTGIHGAD